MTIKSIIKAIDRIEKNQYLYEGLNAEERDSVKLWESAGYALKEANLTADQIQQLFKSVEQGATAAGGNRTMIGKGKDAAVAINKAWEDLKTKVQSSGPMKNVDAAYDSAVAKIQQGLGGPDNAVNQVIQKYRKFAKDHPIAQGLIYSALIAAAGISGAGLGGAAVLGLLKMTDKLLQGEKFTSAAYSGAKTGALAYGASKIGDYIKGQSPSQTPSQSPPVGGGNWVKQFADAGRDYVAKGGDTDLNSMQTAADQYVKSLEAKGITNPQRLMTARDIFLTAAKGAVADAAGGTVNYAGGQISRESIKLSESQIQTLFVTVSDSIVLEGFLDRIKQVGQNLTTKITADKLTKAWTAAGSPTDSAVVADILKKAGVDDSIITSTFKTLGISATSAASTPKQPASKAPNPATSSQITVSQINKALASFRLRDLQSIQKTVDAALAKRSVAE